MDRRATLADLGRETHRLVREAEELKRRGRKLQTWLFYYALCERLPPRRVDDDTAEAAVAP